MRRVEFSLVDNLHAPPPPTDADAPYTHPLNQSRQIVMQHDIDTGRPKSHFPIQVSAKLDVVLRAGTPNVDW